MCVEHVHRAEALTCVTLDPFIGTLTCLVQLETSSSIFSPTSYLHSEHA